MAPPLLETLVSERTPGSKPLYGHAAQEIIVTTVAHTTDGWATDGAKVPPSGFGIAQQKYPSGQQVSVPWRMPPGQRSRPVGHTHVSPPR
jgi:hypothetical protein